MVLILPSFDAEGEKTFTPPATVGSVQEPGWHNWLIGLSVAGLTILGLWVIWGEAMVLWVDTLG